MPKKSINMLKECWSSRNIVMETFLISIIMLVSIYAFGMLMGIIIPRYSYDILASLQNTLSNLLFLSGITIAYTLVILLVYSFFKLIMINLVKNKKINFAFLWKFLLFNIIISIVLIAVFFLLWAAISYTFNSSQAASITYFVIFLFFAYAFVNFSQLDFFKEKKYLKSIKKGFLLVFSSIGQYIRIILTDAVYFLLLIVLFLIVGSIYKAAIYQKTSAAYITGYNFAFSVVVSLFVVLLGAYSFYFLNKIIERQRTKG